MMRQLDSGLRQIKMAFMGQLVYTSYNMQVEKSHFGEREGANTQDCFVSRHPDNRGGTVLPKRPLDTSHM